MLEDLPKAWVAMGHEDVRAEGQESRARRLSLSESASDAGRHASFGDEAEVIRELKDTLGLKFVEKVTRTLGLTPGLRNFSRACTDPACLGTSALSEVD